MSHLPSDFVYKELCEEMITFGIDGHVLPASFDYYTNTLNYEAVYFKSKEDLNLYKLVGKFRNSPCVLLKVSRR